MTTIRNYLTSLLHSKAKSIVFLSAQDNIQDNSDKIYNLLCSIVGTQISTGYIAISRNNTYMWIDERYTTQVQFLTRKKNKKYILRQYSSLYRDLIFLSNTYQTWFVCFHNITINIANILGRKSIFDICSLSSLFSYPQTKKHIYNHSLQYAGISHYEKIDFLVQKMRERNIELLFIHKPEKISWLLNIRSYDTPYTPCPQNSFLIISNTKVHTLYTNHTPHITFEKNIDCILFSEFVHHMKSKYGKYKTISLESDITFYPFHILKSIFEINILKDCLLRESIAIKNDQETQGAIKAHIMDGIVLCEFFSQAKQKIQQGYSEYELDKYLLSLKREWSSFICPSFHSISAFDHNTAMIHYKYDSSYSPCHKLYLLDSGSQYLYGTTDITRTISLSSQPSDKIKTLYTQVLKSHIKVALSTFPSCTSLKDIDTIGHYTLWKMSYHYPHSTSHGVGSCLSVHEDCLSNNRITSSMIISNEPGYYEENWGGIRIENLYYTKKIKKNFLLLQYLTCVPLENALIDKKKLTREEIEWINKYHQYTHQVVYSALSNNAKKWLLKKIEPI